MTPDGHHIFAVDFDKTLILGNTWPNVDGKANKPMIEYLNMERRKKGNEDHPLDVPERTRSQRRS